MSIFFDEDKALTPKANESWSKGPRTDISENFAAVSKAFSMTELTQSELRNNEEEYGNVVQLLHENGNSNFINPLDPMNYMVDDIEIAPSTEEMEADFWNRVNNAKQNNEELTLKLKEAGYDSRESMQKVIAKKAQDAFLATLPLHLARSASALNCIASFSFVSLAFSALKVIISLSVSNSNCCSYKASNTVPDKSAPPPA
tara:strand:- start:405 stop:1007 length:603 start_codon:yes stop_codon:yes gene_type:complete